MSGISVVGAGAFGTALAVSLARAGQAVTLWARSIDHAAAIESARQNEARLPGVPLPAPIRATASSDAFAHDILLLAVPTQTLSGFLEHHASALDGRMLVLCCKGLDLATGLRPTELVAQHCPESPVAVLTGPSFADDIARGLPTALTLASATEAGDLQRRLATQALRLYLTHDVVGAELGGALKNVIALAAGLTIGAGLGESARAAVVTRGFAEISRFAVAEGALPETLSGLSGLGDLLLTATSTRSRNFSAGLALGAGRALPANTTIEGLATADAVSNLARYRGIEMPLGDMVAAVAHGRISVRDAADALMSRPLKKE